MTIRIYDNRIDFGNYSLVVDNIGITVRTSNSNVTATLTAVDIQYMNYPFQGTVAGFTSGGWQPPAYNVIDKFPFANAMGNAFDVGDLTQARCLLATQSSSIHGYTSAGYLGPPNTNVIDKFTFAVNQNAIDVGDLTQGRYGPCGQSSNTAGYTSGGIVPGVTNVIDKFPFSVDTNASDVGDLTQARYYATGHSSTTHGYVAGGVSSNVIDRFPFATNANASDVGDTLSSSAYQIASGISSQHHGYVTGGGWPGSNSNVIQRFSFITNQNSSDIGDLTAGRYGAAGSSSTVAGYTSGGATAPYTVQNIIDRFPFAASEGAYICTDVGDLTVARGYMSGQQD